MNNDERAKKLAEAQMKFGRPFVTALPVCRATDKGWRLREIEARQKEEAKRRTVVNIKKEAK